MANQAPKLEFINADNKLRDYSSYTYGLSLHMLLPENYNKLLLSGQIDYANTNVLIASAGRHNDTTFKRNSEFEDDFYFDDLEVTTIIGMSQKTRSSNAVDMSFKIIEPYGMTLLNRILSAVDNSTERGRNYLDIPYMLQIDFYGYDDAGSIANLSDLTKHIPIKIVGIKMNVTTKGSEYTIKAIQYHDQAFTETMGSLPSGITFTADKVGTFLDKLSAALNKAQADLVPKKLREVADEYYFEIEDDNIKNSGILLNGVNPKVSPITDVRGVARVSSSVGSDDRTGRRDDERRAGLDLKNITSTFNEGTSLLVIIESLIKSSTFFRDQIKLNEADAVNSPIYWVRVVPTVKLGKFDKKINRYAKIMTYKLIKYRVYNNKYPGGPAAKADETKHSVKQYEYIYSGKNTEILDFQLEFDAMFFVFVTSDKAKLSTIDVGGTGLDGVVSGSSSSATVTNSSGSPKTRAIKPGDKTTASSAGNKDDKAVAASDQLNSMVAGSKGDMVQVKLKILGDPDFIKQDGIFYTDGSAGNSIPTDSGEIYVTLRFRTPNDLNEATGLYDFDSKSTLTTSVFSGLYRVLTVKNGFRAGRFEQELQLVRLFDQKYDFVTQG